MEEKKLKEIEHHQEKAQDKDWIQSVVVREKALDKLEAEIKVKSIIFSIIHIFIEYRNVKGKKLETFYSILRTEPMN